MKKNILIFLLLCSNIFADEFDLDENQPGDVVFPMTQAEIREFTPLLPRMLTKEELEKKKLKEAEEKAKKEKAERIKKAKIEKNFAKKSDLKEVKKKDIKVKVDKKEVDFFESLDDSANQPIDME